MKVVRPISEILVLCLNTVWSAEASFRTPKILAL